jgi:hypothetical protein
LRKRKTYGEREGKREKEGEGEKKACSRVVFLILLFTKYLLSLFFLCSLTFQYVKNYTTTHPAKIVINNFFFFFFAKNIFHPIFKNKIKLQHNKFAKKKKRNEKIQTLITFES